MRRLAEEAGKDPEMPFTSLIDIVFLLLIFFMCATRFKQVEQRLDAFLPEDGRCLLPPTIRPPEELTIYVRDDATMRASENHNLQSMRRATYYFASRDATPVHHANVMMPALQRLAVNPDQRVLIALYDETAGKDQLVPFFNVVAVMDACKAAGIQNVAFQAPAAMGP